MDSNAALIAASVLVGAAVIFVVMRNKSKKSGKRVLVSQMSDMKNGEMKEVQISDKGHKVLLIRNHKGEFFATGTKCSHYGAPLVNGVLHENRVTCPWHAACFNVCTGEIEEAPAVDAIPHFDVEVCGESVYVLAPTEFPASFRRTPAVTGAPCGNKECIVLVGGGPASLVAAQTLRTEGFQGRIVIISKEAERPYDRVKLSKSFGVDIKNIALKSAEWFVEHNIELVLNTAVEQVSLANDNRYVLCSDKTRLPFDKLLIATGGDCRVLRCEGHELQNIFTVRQISDNDGMAAAVKGARRAVVIGSSFIGMEVAAAFVGKKLDVTVVGMETVPFERVLGTEVGRFMQTLHESKGVSFRMNAKLKRYVGEGGKVSGVELESGEVLACDLVVLGAGIIPATAFLEGVLPMERDGSIVVNECMEAAPNVYVVGDIARFRYWCTGDSIRVEHWNVAQQQARVAACNMVGRTTAYTSVPFFWSSQYGLSLRYAGNAMAPDQLVVKGSFDDRKFAVYYCQKGKVLACATLGCDPVAVAVSELLRTSTMCSPADLEANDLMYPCVLSRSKGAQ